MIYSKDQIASFHEHKFAYIVTNEKDHVLTVTLNRPDKKNALTPVMLNEFAFALSYAHHNNDIRVVVIAANGDVFCAGADMLAFAKRNESSSLSTVPEPEKEIVLGELFTCLHKPAIARVHAPVYAGGFLIICGCAYVVASDNAVFSLPEVKRGLWPMQVMESLLHIMPQRKVLDLCVLGKKITATEAYNIGLITHLSDSNSLDEKVSHLAQEICNNSPTAIRLGLKAYDEMRSIDSKSRHAFLKRRLEELLKTEDAKEGITAFGEKRKPVWKGV